MTQEEMIMDLHEALGELSDLEYRNPLSGLPDVTTKGWIDMSRILNEAQLKIAMHKNANGRVMRMRLAETVGRLMVRRISAVVVAYTGNTLTLLTSTNPADFYRGMLVSGANGGKGIVFIHYLGVPNDSLILSNVSGTFTAGEAITIIQREYHFADNSAVATMTEGFIWFSYLAGRPVEITGVIDSEGNEIVLSESAEKWTDVAATEGVPTTYTKVAGGIKFETYPDGSYTYLVRAMRSPTPMVSTDTTATPEIPEIFHRCMVLYAHWWFLTRGQELQSAYGVRRTFEEMLRDSQTEFDLQDRTQRGQFKFYTEGK